MIKKASALAISIFALFLAGASSRASAGSPVAGPLEVSVESFTSMAAPGDLAHVGVAVQNHATHLTLQVALRTTIVYSDGRRQTLLLDSPILLGPDEGFVQVAFFPVPPGAPPGTATVHALAVVTHVSGGNPDGLARPLVATDQDVFEVVAALSDSSGGRSLAETRFVNAMASTGSSPRRRRRES